MHRDKMAALMSSFVHSISLMILGFLVSAARLSVVGRGWMEG